MASGAARNRLFEASHAEVEHEFAHPNCDFEQLNSLLEQTDRLDELSPLARRDHSEFVVTFPQMGRSPTSEILIPDQPSLSRSKRWQWLEHWILRSQFGYPPEPASPITKLLAQLALWKFHTREQRREWIPFRAPGRLLDVGCMASPFRERMQAFGWTVTGLNVGEDIRHDNERELGITIHSGNLPQLEMDAQSFDVVTMRHLLDRVPNPQQWIQQAATLIRPGGLLVIEVPNIESRTFNEFREHWFGLNRPYRLQQFSPKTLSEIIPKDQLRIVEIQQIGMRSWIKRSAQRAVTAGQTHYQSWLARGKSFWNEQAQLSEIANQGDCIRIIAEPARHRHSRFMRVA